MSCSCSEYHTGTAQGALNSAPDALPVNPSFPFALVLVLAGTSTKGQQPTKRLLATPFVNPKPLL